MKQKLKDFFESLGATLLVILVLAGIGLWFLSALVGSFGG